MWGAVNEKNGRPGFIFGNPRRSYKNNPRNRVLNPEKGGKNNKSNRDKGNRCNSRTAKKKAVYRKIAVIGDLKGVTMAKVIVALP